MIPNPFRASTPRPQPEPDEQEQAREWLESTYRYCEKCGEVVGDANQSVTWHCGRRVS